MPIKSWAVAALLLPFAAAACRDEDPDIRALTNMAQTTTATTQDARTPPASPGTPMSPDKHTGHGGRAIDLPDRAGSVEWVWKAGKPTGRLYFTDADANPVRNVEKTSLWLAESDGPRELALEPCRPAESGCWQVELPAPTEAAPHGVVRFELGHEPYRIALPTRQPDPAVKPPASWLERLPAEKLEQR